MPVYEYECTKCGGVVEAIQKLSDKPLSKCKSCSGKLQKLISQSTFHLKGSGWYVTDYSNKTKETKEPIKNSGETPKKETKKETKTTSKKSEE